MTEIREIAQSIAPPEIGRAKSGLVPEGYTSGGAESSGDPVTDDITFSATGPMGASNEESGHSPLADKVDELKIAGNTNETVPSSSSDEPDTSANEVGYDKLAHEGGTVEQITFSDTTHQESRVPAEKTPDKPPLAAGGGKNGITTTAECRKLTQAEIDALPSYRTGCTSS
jgi:hypothetical protein